MILRVCSFVFLLVVFACREEEAQGPEEKEPYINMLDPRFVDYTEAELLGEMTFQREGDFEECGFVWSTTPQPMLGNSPSRTLFAYHPGVTDLSFHAVELKTNTRYYARGYITTESGTTYGNEISFTTLALFRNSSGVIHYGPAFLSQQDRFWPGVAYRHRVTLIVVYKLHGMVSNSNPYRLKIKAAYSAFCLLS